jgi:hypothetical protein
MDFKKFGMVVLILGIAVFAYGAFQWLSNASREEYEYSKVSLMDNSGHMMRNQESERNQADAVKYLIAGGIVAFLGVGISYSSKKQRVDPDSPPNPPHGNTYC